MIAHKWQPISPLAEDCGHDFSEIDSLQRQWIDYRRAREADQPDTYSAFLERLTRSWAIETGIIEGLYTLDRGITETLVMRGISADLIDQSSTNKDPQELARILRDHENAVNYVYRNIRDGRPLSSFAVKEMHILITRNQPTFWAVDQFGRFFDARLEHGEFKKQPNNPTRPDGEIHEYCPWEQVASELDNLITWYNQYIQNTQRYHPLLTAAWLHHRFTQIHPFQDGNGRVVRTLLTWHLVREGYLPSVVKRDDRTDYIGDLEKADANDLLPFVDLLVRLQKRTILEALGEPEFTEQVGIVDRVSIGLVDQVLDHIVEQISRKDADRAEQLRSVNAIARSLSEASAELLNERAYQVTTRLYQTGRAMSSHVLQGGPGEREHWYRQQVVQTANNSGHWANLNESRFFIRLTVTPEQASLHPRLVFVISLHHTGRQLSGIMATTAFALIDHYYDGIAGQVEEAGEPLFIDCTLDPFILTGMDSAHTLPARFSEWVDQRLAMALRQWGEYLT